MKPKTCFNILKEENEKNKLANTVYLFTDGSVNTTTKIGVGGYLICSEISNNLLESDVVLKTLQNTSSTKLELQTFLWAIRQVNHERKNVIAFSDSQNLISLIDRKEKLIKNNFKSSTWKLLNNAELYQEFYNITKGLNIEFVKLKGHSKMEFKSDFDKVFKLVDKATRRALRSL